MATVTLESMSTADLAEFALLATQSESEGYQFLRRMHDEWVSGVLRFSRPGERVALARAEGRVIGVGGLCCDPYLKAGDVGRLRHMYVHPAHRGSGVGRRLLEFLLCDWAQNFSRIRLRAANDASGRFYEAYGFQVVTLEDHCTHVLFDS